MKKKISLMLAVLMILNIVSVMMVSVPFMSAGAAIVYGDVNDDGEVNSQDVTVMMQKVAGWNVANFNEEAADVNNDGEFNAADTTLLMQAVAGWTVQLGPTAAPANKTLKVLAIGNSFSVDAMSYLYDLAKDAGCTEINLGNLYISGCSIATHLSNANNNTAAYTYYYANSSTNGVMKSTGSKTLLYGIEAQDWDIITLQHASGDSNNINKYNSDIDALVAYVNSKKTNSNAKIMWHQTWAYQWGYNGCDQTSMYNGICNGVSTKIVTNNSFSGVIPVGTAIQNIRSSWLGDNFNRDGRHLNNLGKYVAGMTWVKYLTGLSIDSITWTPDGVVPDKNLYLPIIKEAVNNAVTTPLALTQSSYTASPTPDPNATPTPTPSPTPVPAQAGTVYYQSFDTVADKDAAITEGFVFSKASGNYSRGGNSTDYYGSFTPSGNYIMVTFAPIALTSASYGPNTKIEASYEIARNRVTDGSWNYAGFVDAEKYKTKSSNDPKGVVVAAGHRPKDIASATSGVWVYRKTYGSEGITTPSASELLVAGQYNKTTNIWYKFKYVITLTNAQGQAITPTVDIYVDNMTTPVMTGKAILDSSSEYVSGFVIASVAGSAKYYVDEILVRLIDDNTQ